jgi:branched-chain amino acid transport system substrate-binding protein
MRRVLMIFGIILAFGAAMGTWTSPVPAAAQEVVIGNILPLSGPVAPIGKVGREIREMAVEEINAAGGIKSMGGAKLKMIYADSRGDPKVAMTEAERLITQDKVACITGAFQSAVTYPSTEVAERYKIPYLVPVSVRDAITERGFKYVFRLAAKASWYARDQINFIKALTDRTGLAPKKLAFVYENTDWGTSTAEGWRPLAKEGGFEVVLDEPYPANAPDLTPVVLKIKRAKPDFILFVSYIADATLLMNTMAEHEVDVMGMIGSGGGHSDPQFIPNTGKNSIYFFDAVEWEADLNRPGLKETNKKFKDRYGYNISPEAANVYAAMYVLKDALERAGSADPEKLRDALAKTNYTKGPGMIVPYEKISFDKEGQNPEAQLVVVQIRQMPDGSVERCTIYPWKVARAGYEPIYPIPTWKWRKAHDRAQ